MALTATATPKVQREIIDTLELSGGCGHDKGDPVVVITSFDRPNLYYSAIEKSDSALIAALQPLVSKAKKARAVPVGMRSTMSM